MLSSQESALSRLVSEEPGALSRWYFPNRCPDGPHLAESLAAGGERFGRPPWNPMKALRTSEAASCPMEQAALL